jgi:hypothetical protein
MSLSKYRYLRSSPRTTKWLLSDLDNRTITVIVSLATLVSNTLSSLLFQQLPDDPYYLAGSFGWYLHFANLLSIFGLVGALRVSHLLFASHSGGYSLKLSKDYIGLRHLLISRIATFTQHNNFFTLPPPRHPPLLNTSPPVAHPSPTPFFRILLFSLSSQFIVLIVHPPNPLSPLPTNLLQSIYGNRIQFGIPACE